MSPTSPFPGYTTAEVARILDLSPRQVRSYVEAGFLSPRRGPGRRYVFSFQDLVILRAARGLCRARIPARRVHRALDRLRRQLPRGRSLTAVSISAEGGEIVVRDGGEAWEPVSGQRVLDFEVAELAEKAAPVALRVAARARKRPQELDAEAWWELGWELETTAPEEARDAYARALELAPEHADAHLNLGRLLHEQGKTQEAMEHYRRAAALRPEDPTAAFNLGVALEDLGRAVEAADAYRKALAADPSYADAHYNLAGLEERRGDPAAAIRHLKAYKTLVESP